MGKAPDRIGNYRIDGRLRVGGMGVLYLGSRIGPAGFSRQVAIKVIHPHLSRDPRFIRMFVDEALLSARVDHPNVARVEELGMHDESYFLVMEYVEGCSLAQLLAQLGRLKRRLTPEVAVWIATQIADGLHAAHETRGEDGELLGVVHRDVSPQNVLLAHTGHVKLIDFGIAKARGKATQTQTGTIRGKVRYMSPEQARAADVDRRSDVFSLAVVLWEMLTTRHLFAAESDLDLLDLVRHPRVSPPSLHAPDVEPALEAAVLGALSIDAADRPADALVLRENLATAVPSAMLIGAPRLAELIESVMADVTSVTPSSGPAGATAVLSAATAVHDERRTTESDAYPPSHSHSDPDPPTIADPDPPTASLSASSGSLRPLRSAGAETALLTLTRPAPHANTPEVGELVTPVSPQVVATPDVDQGASRLLVRAVAVAIVLIAAVLAVRFMTLGSRPEAAVVDPASRAAGASAAVRAAAAVAVSAGAEDRVDVATPPRAIGSPDANPATRADPPLYEPSVNPR